jgi:hypothetical protein
MGLAGALGEATSVSAAAHSNSTRPQVIAFAKRWTLP